MQTLQTMRTFDRHAHTNKLGISLLDKILEIFVNPKGKTEEVIIPPWASSQPQILQDITKKTKAPVIELVGASPCSGKTQLLLYIAATALLPATYRGVELGGKEGAVVWLDTAGRLDIIRLRDIMYNYVLGCIRRSNPKPSGLDGPSLQELLATSLQHLHIFRPQSSQAFMKTLEVLQIYLFDNRRHISSARRLHVMIIDNISAYHWQDRAEEDEEQAGDRWRKNSFIEGNRNITEALKMLQKVFECMILVGNWGLNPIERNEYGSYLRPHLPAVWNNFVAVRLIVERDKVVKFVPSMSAEEALEDDPRRQEAVQASRFSAWLNRWDCSRWGNDILRSVECLDDKGRLSFEVTTLGTKILERNDN